MERNINLNENRYIQLLKKQEILKNEGRSLFEENRQEDIELLSYGIILENQIYYSQKADYIFLLEKYLKENAGEDGARLFVWEFFKVFKHANKALKILEKEILQQGISKLAAFPIDPKSTEFADLINEIASSCEFLTFDPEDSYGMTLDQFRESIQRIYSKI